MLKQLYGLVLKIDFPQFIGVLHPLFVDSSQEKACLCAIGAVGHSIEFVGEVKDGFFLLV